MMPVPVLKRLHTFPLSRPTASTGADTWATELISLQSMRKSSTQVCFVEQADYEQAQAMLAEHEVKSTRSLTTTANRLPTVQALTFM
jgi:hypothetical protein